jgi:two-component system, OmpR family, KDP operon response regulator KdpE
MSFGGKHIVLIDDTSSIRTFLRISLQSHGATIHEAATAMDGLALCQEVNPDLVVLDLGLPDKDGLDLLPEIKQTVDTKVIILSVRKDSATIEQALTRGASAHMSKPFLMDDLLGLINKQLYS